MYDFDTVQIYVILHLKKAGVDYAKMMAKLTGLQLEEINKAISGLVELGILERDSGSAIKKSKARFKKAHEVHKHHTYYRLTRKGTIFARKIDIDWLREYFRRVAGNDVMPAILELSQKGKLESKREFEEELRELGFLTEKGRRTKFFQAFCYVSGLDSSEA